MSTTRAEGVIMTLQYLGRQRHMWGVKMFTLSRSNSTVITAQLQGTWARSVC